METMTLLYILVSSFAISCFPCLFCSFPFPFCSSSSFPFFFLAFLPAPLNPLFKRRSLILSFEFPNLSCREVAVTLGRLGAIRVSPLTPEAPGCSKHGGGKAGGAGPSCTPARQLKPRGPIWSSSRCVLSSPPGARRRHSALLLHSGQETGRC